MQGRDDLQDVDDILDLINKIAKGVQARHELDEFKKEQKSKKDKSKSQRNPMTLVNPLAKTTHSRTRAKSTMASTSGRTAQTTQTGTKIGRITASQTKPKLSAKQTNQVRKIAARKPRKQTIMQLKAKATIRQPHAFVFNVILMFRMTRPKTTTSMPKKVM